MRSSSYIGNMGNPPSHGPSHSEKAQTQAPSIPLFRGPQDKQICRWICESVGAKVLFSIEPPVSDFAACKGKAGIAFLENRQGRSVATFLLRLGLFVLNVS